MPFALMTAAASGVARYLIRALAASGSLAAALTPAVFNPINPSLKLENLIS